MSTGQIDNAYTYGSKTFDVPERGTIRIDDCPPTISEQLQRASFKQESSDVFVKTQVSLDDTDQEYRVVEVQVDDSVIQIDVGDNVGIVSLTPRSKLQIKPKIEWDHIIDMLLAVHGRKRSVEYHGIPLSRFQRDDIDLKDVLIFFLNKTVLGLGFISSVAVLAIKSRSNTKSSATWRGQA